MPFHWACGTILLPNTPGLAISRPSRSLSRTMCTPASALRPLNQITNLDWKPEDEDPRKFIASFGKPPGEADKDFSKSTAKLTQEEIGSTLRDKWHINPPDKNCAGCHR